MPAQIKEQSEKIWLNLVLWQKATLLGIVFLAFVGIIALLAFNLTRPSMEPLYTNLDPADASSIIAKLKEQKVSYELADEGRTILVAADEKYQLRLDMAGQVNLTGIVGFESFNETRFGETDTDKRVRFLVALQGELTRTIEEMDEVESAKVHIALPAPSLFIGDSIEPTASVLLRLKPYAQIKPEQVKSVMAFVSNSVEGLKVGNVTIMDVNGNLLSDGLDDSAAGTMSKASMSQLALKQQYETDLARSVQSMLERMLGAGKVVVRTSIDMDFDQIETHSEKYGDSVLVNEQSKEESSTGNSSSTGGNPADENMGQTSYGSSGTTGVSSYQLIENIKNYEISKVTETKIVAPGKVTKLSVSVLIDGELNREAEERLNGAVSKAAGLDSARGDQVSIVAMPFNSEQTKKMEEEMVRAEKSMRTREYVKYGLIGLAVILLLGAMIFVFKGLQNTVKRSAAYVPPFEQAAATSQVDIMNTLSPELLEKKSLRTQVDKIVESNPEEAAKVIKSWLAEEQV